jgi:hypothetical protein
LEERKREAFLRGGKGTGGWKEAPNRFGAASKAWMGRWLPAVLYGKGSGEDESKRARVVDVDVDVGL